MTGETKDQKGVVPESWLCVDCGFNTAPGLLNRAEMEAAFAATPEGVTNTFNRHSEVYTLRATVWKATGMEPYGGCLCIGCVEKRLGRRLRPKDFRRGHPFNQPNVPGTARLISRRTGQPEWEIALDRSIKG